MRFNPKRTRGFSTIEVLVAFAVLSLGLVLATRAVSEANWSLRRAVEVSAETRLARRVMAEEVPVILKARAFQESRVREAEWEVLIQPMQQGGVDRNALVTVRVRVGGRFDTVLVRVLSWPSEGD